MNPSGSAAIKLKGAVFVLAVICLFGLPAYGALYSGGGTEADPYIISTAAEMNDIGNNPNDFGSYFLLTADIDLGGYTGTSFNIIGTPPNSPFTGIFDGNGHTISNFSYTATEQNYTGLFRYVDEPNAEIKNLGLIDPNVDAGKGIAVGSLVGLFVQGTIWGCYSINCSVAGEERVSGLAGWNLWGTVHDCYAIGAAEGNYDVGGLIGSNNGNILNSYAKVVVSGRGGCCSGGFVGFNNDDGYISKCYATGSVIGISNAVGGFVGSNYGSIFNSYATGNADGNMVVGGFIGSSWEGTITACYSTGAVDGNDLTGGLTGFHQNSSYTKCFWDMDINPDVNGIGNTTDPNVIGESTVNMQTASTFTNAGWDFVDEIDNGVQDIWRLCNEGAEYPQLNWQFLLGDFVCPDGVEINDLAALIEQWLLEKLSADVAPDGGDGFVDFLDWAVFANGWQSTTDINDLAVFIEQWLQFSAYCADIAPAPDGDGIVNMLDFAVLADNWLVGVE